MRILATLIVTAFALPALAHELVRALPSTFPPWPTG